MAKWIFLLRAFFPSWKFFVEPGPCLTLEYRFSQGPWISSLEKIPRTFLTTFFNPRGNLLHACHNNLLHLAQDIEKLPANADPASLISYQITHNMVRFFLPTDRQTHRSYQFRVREERSSQILIESPTHDL